MQLPMTINEIHTEDPTSPYFRNIYFYQAQNILPAPKAGKRQVERQSENIFCLTHYC